MKILSPIPALLLAVMACSSCSVLKSAHYAGEMETVSEEDLARESIWMCNDAVYYVHRSGSNTFVAATLEWNEQENAYAVESFPLFLSTLGDHLFLNIKGEDGLYTIFRAAPAGCSDSAMALVLFSVDKDEMRKAIAAGTIKGHMDGNDVALDCSKAEQDEYIRNNIRTMFGMDPMLSAKLILEKDKKDKKAEKKEAAKPAVENK